MGRAIPREGDSRPAGFKQESNSVMMEELWLNLASAARPELLEAGTRPPSLEQLFEGDWLRGVTWRDFFNAFPYELRDHGCDLDELDALALLLGSPANRKRFERFCEHHAAHCSNLGSSSSSSSNPGSGNLQQPLGLAGPSPFERSQHASLPVRRRGQQQQQPVVFHLRTPVPPAAAAGPNTTAVAYVGPDDAAGDGQPPPRRLAPTVGTAAMAAGALPGLVQQMQRMQELGQHELSALMLRALGLPEPPPAAAPPPPPRLSGRRRSRLTMEACETPDTAGGAAAAAAGQRQAAAADAGAAGSSGQQADNRRVWRAVHDLLTSDDESLLLTVSRLLPASCCTEQLRDEGQVAQQLRALAASRRVPERVVSLLAERLSAGADTQLLQITARSGYSRRAAAAAAALAVAGGRRLLYVPLAGLHREEEVEAALMRGIFSSAALQRGAASRAGSPSGSPHHHHHHQQQQRGAGSSGSGRDADGLHSALFAVMSNLPAQLAIFRGAANAAGGGAGAASAAGGAGAAAAAAAAEESASDGDDDDEEEEEGSELPPGHDDEHDVDWADEQRRVMEAAGAAGAGARGRGAQGSAAAAQGSAAAAVAAAAEAAQAATAASNAAVRAVDAAERVGAASAASAAVAAAAAASHAAEAAAQQAARAQALAAAVRAQIAAGQGTPSALAAAAAGPAAAAEDEEQEEEEQEEEGSGLDVERLHAYLALLGTCSRSPLLLLLDEVDAALLAPDGGGHFRALLLRLMRALPQAVVVTTASCGGEGGEGLGGELRRQGRPVAYAVHDGVLQVAGYSLQQQLFFGGCYRCY